ncbi:kinase-like domain-containing protein [Aspergillus oleicola]
MGQIISTLADLDLVNEVFDPATGEFQYTTCAVFEEQTDQVCLTRLTRRKADLARNVDAIRQALQFIPDTDIYPLYPGDQVLHRVSDHIANEEEYEKHQDLYTFDVFQRHGMNQWLVEGLLYEAHVMEVLRQNPHPNIVKYHGCKMRRGFITALVMERHKDQLQDVLKNGRRAVDKEVIMAGLESAVTHLHSLGLAHNDLNPAIVRFTTAGVPVLADFGSCRKIGDKLGSSRGTMGWIEGPPEKYLTSEVSHDIYGLERIREWLDNPTFGT